MSKIVPEKANLKVCKRLFKNVDFVVLSRAIKSLYATSSVTHGGDCLSIGLVVSEFLKTKGVSARVVIGESSWRVDGADGGAVIVHANTTGEVVTMPTSNLSANHVPFHAWVELNDVWCLDLSTYQFPMKMGALDEHDGITTPVTWKPDFLLFKYSDVSSFEEVKNAFSSGVVHYKPDVKTAEIVQKYVDVYEFDEADVVSLAQVYEGIKSGVLTVVAGPMGSVMV